MILLNILDLAAHVIVGVFATWLVLTLALHVALRLWKRTTRSDGR